MPRSNSYIVYNKNNIQTIEIQQKFLMYNKTCFKFKIEATKHRRFVMNFKLKKTKEKVKSGYKTLYISQTLIDKINEIAEEE